MGQMKTKRRREKREDDMSMHETKQYLPAAHDL